MSNEPESGEKKIIIDEDWKSQVEREKAQAAQAAEGGQPPNPEAANPEAATSEAATSESASEMTEPELPPPSLPFLISTMAAQCMAAMGQLPDPITGKPEIRLKFAKHHVDMLAVLQEKTQGNTTEEEAMMLEDALHQLRMMYVQLESQLA
jgi:hypothetical protein